MDAEESVVVVEARSAFGQSRILPSSQGDTWQKVAVWPITTRNRFVIGERLGNAAYCWVSNVLQGLSIIQTFGPEFRLGNVRFISIGVIGLL